MLTESTQVKPEEANQGLENQAISSTDFHEIDFAQLTGYIDDEPSLDATEIAEFESPEQHRTSQTIISSPFSKVALVGGAGILGFAVVGLFVNSIMSTNSKQAVATVDKDPKNLVAASSLDPKDAELAKVKTDLAMGSQVSSKPKNPSNLLSSDLQRNSLDPKDKAATNSSVNPANSNLQPVVPPSQLPPPSNLTTVPIDPEPVRPPVRQVMSPSPVMFSPQSSNPVAQPTNSLEEWQRLASIGSYGSVTSDSSRSVASISNNQVVIPNNQVVIPNNQVVIPNNQVASANPIPRVEQPSNSLTNYLARSQSSTQARIPNNTLSIGTTAKASIKTPVVFAPTGNLALGNGIPKFIVNLDEPILTVDGRAVIPSGALLIVTVRPLDAKSGLSELDVVSISINGKEFTPPTNAITIRGAEGGPLVADNYFDYGSQIAGMDLSTVLITAAAEVGKLTNNPTNTSSISTVGGFSTSTTTPTPDFIGAAVSGGLGYLSKALIARNLDSTKEFATRPNVFYMAAGKQVQVFINQTTTF